jgi:hypothetical protein
MEQDGSAEGANAERRKPKAESRTPNAERRTPNAQALPIERATAKVPTPALNFLDLPS